MRQLPVLGERMQHIGALARGQLERMEKLLPAVPPVDRDAYFAAAQEAAARDPEFRAAFERALAQYEGARQGVGDASRKGLRL